MTVTSHTLSVLVENKPGALARVAGLFARRDFNIDSLAVGETDDPSVSRMTIVVSVEATKPLEQCTKQLHKLINVLRISELPTDAVEREMALIKVSASAGKRAQVLEIAEIFRAKVVDVDSDALVIEATGTPEKVQALEELLRPHGIVEMARTGRIALARGSAGLKAPALRPLALTEAGA